MLRIGIDFGGVIVPNQTDNDNDKNPFFDFTCDRFLTVQECKDARRVLKRLAKQGHQLHLVSKARTKMQKRSLQWLSKNQFIGAIFEPTKIHFCEKRAEKRNICKKQEISLLIDDRSDVLEACLGEVSHLILFGVSTSPDFVSCSDWNMVAKYVESLI